MKIDVASLRQCADPALRTIIQYISLKWGAITPCDGKTWDECRTTFDGHDIVWFNDEHGSTRIYEIT